MAFDLDEVELDSRRRVLLGDRAVSNRYRVVFEPGGVIVLTPVVSIPYAEAQLWQNNPELAKKLVDSVAHPERLERHPISDLGSADQEDGK